MSSLLLAALLLSGASQPQETLPRAQAEVKAGRWSEAAELLSSRLRRAEGTPELHGLYAEVLRELGRQDEAAHQAEQALDLLGQEGLDSTKDYASIRRLLYATDPVARSRHALVEDVIDSYLDIGKKLLGSGHTERALKVLDPLDGHARGKQTRTLESLLEKARAAFERVDLDGAAASTSSASTSVRLESEHYVLDCDLEKETVERLAETMDDIFRYYVEVYFNGDEKRIDKRKATIRVYPDSESMLANWSDPSSTPGGWWSPGDWQVTCYDTRSNGQPIEVMLSTLFHEASHQFMSMLTSRGGDSPSWLNEGTASFFEGAIAMADRRVLWPEAALGRLASLTSQLRGSGELTLEDVVNYDDPGSYPAEYYSFGWGLVYYLQQFESPQTLAHVWRPYYQEYRERITTRGGSSRALFDEVFLAPGNPGGFTTFEQFQSAWTEWILEVVFEEHFGRDRAQLRRRRMENYVRAADLGESPVGEEELLLRALAQAEFLRANPDGESGAGPDEDLAFVLQTQIDVLERLGRKGAAAATIESLLELAEDGRISLAEPELEELGKRMAKLDRRNAPLRLLRLRQTTFRKRALSLLSRYERDELDWHLRSFSLARLLSSLLQEDEELSAQSEELYASAVAANLVPSRIVDVIGKPGPWITVFSDEAAQLEFGDTSVSLSMPGRPAGRLSTALELSGRYEVRGTLYREGELHRSTYHGIVVAGSESQDWYAVGIGAKDKLVVKRCEVDASGSTLLRNVSSERLAAPPAPDAPVHLAVRVEDANTLRIVVGDEEPVVVTLRDPIGFPAHVGLLVKDGAARLENLHVEIFP